MEREKLRSALSGNRTRNEQRRLAAYIAVAVLLLGFYLVNHDRNTAPPEAALPKIEDEQPKQAPPLAQVDRGRLTSVRDSSTSERSELETEAAAHLVDQASLLVYGDLEQLGLRVADREQLELHGAEHRGDALYVLGELQWSEPVSDARGFRVRGEIRDQQGRSWNFLVVTGLFDVQVGDIVKVQGFYLKLYDMLRPDRSVSSGPLIIGEELLRSSYRIAPVTGLRPDLFLRVRDYDLAEASRPLESPEFYELLSYVNTTPREVLFPPDKPLVERRSTDLMRDTDTFRGQPVCVSGLLAAMVEVPLGPRGENPLGLPFVWNIWLSSYRGATLVICKDRPEGLALKQDIVDVDGIYFRRYAYENQRGQPATVAVVIAKDLQRYTAPTDDLSPLLMRITVAIVAVVVIVAWLVGRRDGKESAVARQRRIGRLKKLVGLPGLLRQRDDARPAATGAAGPAAPTSPADAASAAPKPTPGGGVEAPADGAAGAAGPRRG